MKIFYILQTNMWNSMAGRKKQLVVCFSNHAVYMFCYLRAHAQFWKVLRGPLTFRGLLMRPSLWKIAPSALL